MVYIVLATICIIHTYFLQIKQAEVKMAMVLAHHNIPLGAMEHFSPLFPDSEIAKGIAAARTKTTCIVNTALWPHFEEELVQMMRNNPFCLAINGSNDNGWKKYSESVRFSAWPCVY